MLVSVAACRERATVSVAPTVVAERAESTSAPIVPSDLAASSNALGLDLLRGLELASGRPARSNLAFSPASLTTVLVMAWAGAAGDTAAQMKRLLHLPDLTGADALGAAGRLAASLGDANRSARVWLASRLFADGSLTFDADYLRAQSAAGTPVGRVDFKNDSEHAGSHINEWVETQTAQRIRHLVEPAAVRRDSRLALVSVAVFSGKWASPFPREHTTDELFFVDPEYRTPVPTMHELAETGFAEDAEMTALELPYRGGQMSMLFVLPRVTFGVESLEKGLDAARLDAICGSLKPTLVRVSLPKFFIHEERLPVGRILRELGMTSAFDAKGADFTRLAHPASSDDEIYLTEIFHAAVLYVDETGTEAAAATGSVAVAKPVVPAEFKADHPFLFFLRDRGSGLILFMGRVSNP